MNIIDNGNDSWREQSFIHDFWEIEKMSEYNLIFQISYHEFNIHCPIEAC